MKEQLAPPMLSFFGRQELKDEYLKRLQDHYDADEIIKGVYWQNGKGCAVGCTVKNHKAENIHLQLEKELNVGAWLWNVEDYLFEELKNGESKEFPRRLFKAIPVGVSLDKVYHRFANFVLTDIAKDSEDDKVRAAIEGVMSQHEKAIRGEIISLPEIWRSLTAAWSAAVSKMANKLIQLLEECNSS